MEPAQTLALASSFSSLNSLTGSNNYKAMKNISVASRRSFTLQPRSLPMKLIPRFNASMADSVVAASTEGFQGFKDNLVKFWTNTLNCEADVRKRLTVLKLETDHADLNNSHVNVGWDSVEKSSEGTCTSPKQNLGSKWREYQGLNKWEGLLDPLDENLRREIIKNGEFVKASYSAFEFDPQSEKYGCCKYNKCSLLDKVGLKNCGYRVTKNIQATSSIQFPEWLMRVLSSTLNSEGLIMDAKCISRPTSWIGFVAVCDQDKEITRLGRRDIVVAYRGTGTPLEWAENVKNVLTPVDDLSESQYSFAASSNHIRNCCQAKVESGFWSLYKCKDSTGRSASDEVVNEILRLVQLYEGEEISITITGHSLGSALALLTAYELCEIFNKGNKGKCSNVPNVPVTVFSFGGPRVGNRAFCRRLEDIGCRVLRIVNINDVITKVPGLLLNEWMHEMSQRSENVKKIVKVLEKMPWAYCHVGAELRVNNRHSPYLKPNADMSCCHDLEAYLHLVDGFLSSSIPFRSTAKRDIFGLLVNQKANVLHRTSKINHDTEMDKKNEKSSVCY